MRSKSAVVREESMDFESICNCRRIDSTACNCVEASGLFNSDILLATPRYACSPLPCVKAIDLVQTTFGGKQRLYRNETQSAVPANYGLKVWAYVKLSGKPQSPHTPEWVCLALSMLRNLIIPGNLNHQASLGEGAAGRSSLKLTRKLMNVWQAFAKKVAKLWSDTYFSASALPAGG